MIEILRSIDHSLFYFVNHTLANPVLDVVCRILREKLVWIPAYIFAAWYFFKIYGLKPVIVLLAFAGITILFSDQLSSSVIKPLVHRIRPCNNPDINARLLLAYGGSGYSFVSSHAANHFALATFFSLLLPAAKRKLWGPILVLWAAAISFSQVYVGIHYPADVTAGALLGIAIGYLTGFSAVKVISLPSVKAKH